MATRSYDERLKELKTKVEQLKAQERDLTLSVLIATIWEGPGQRSRAFPIYKTKLIQLKEIYNNDYKII